MCGGVFALVFGDEAEGDLSVVALYDGDLAFADELEHGEEQADHFGAVGPAFADLSEGKPLLGAAVAGEAVFDVGGVKGDGCFVVGDVVRPRLADGVEHPAERLAEVHHVQVVDVELDGCCIGVGIGGSGAGPGGCAVGVSS